MRPLTAILSLLMLTGCAGLIDRAADQFTDDLELAVRSYPEPLIAAQGLPAYLLLLEARLQSRPQDVAMRLAAARLTTSYAVLFVDEQDPDAGRRLHRHALEHARLATCQSSDRLCDLHRLSPEDFRARREQFRIDQLDAIYILAASWTGWLAAHADDFSAVADLPQLESLLEWVAGRSPEHDDGAIWLYLAVLHSQRPPAAGGQPRRSREYFERARAVSDGRNLLVNVLMAEFHARPNYDRELFERLLEKVLSAPEEHNEFRLVNQIARQRARAMLAQSDAWFD